MKRLAFWVAGFVLLFLINVLAESVILPALGLHGSKNDFYFIAWWGVVLLWLLFGYFATGREDSEAG